LNLGDLEDIRLETSLASPAISPAQPLAQAEQATNGDPEDAHLLLDQVDHVASDPGRVAADVVGRAVVPGQFRWRVEQLGIERWLENLRERGINIMSGCT